MSLRRRPTQTCHMSLVQLLFSAGSSTRMAAMCCRHWRSPTAVSQESVMSTRSTHLMSIHICPSNSTMACGQKLRPTRSLNQGEVGPASPNLRRCVEPVPKKRLHCVKILAPSGHSQGETHRGLLRKPWANHPRGVSVLGVPLYPPPS